VCGGKQIGVWWEADWCAISCRLVCVGKQIGVMGIRLVCDKL
jgi:hypothetical protein